MNKLKQLSFVTLRLSALCYIFSILFLYFMQEQLIFPGAAIPADEVQTLRKILPDTEISYHVEDIHLHGWHLNRKRNKPIIFYYGGNADNLTADVLRFAGIEDFQTVLVNYRGYGLSGGKPSEKAIYKDALMIFDDVIKKWRPEKTLVIGRSLGTGVATYVASQRPIDAMVLVTPFDSAVAVGQNTYPLMPISLLMQHRFDSASRAEQLEMPMLVFKSESDRIVPHRFTDQLLEKLSKAPQVVTVPRTNHITIVDSPVYFGYLKEFLIKHIL